MGYATLNLDALNDPRVTGWVELQDDQLYDHWTLLRIKRMLGLPPIIETHWQALMKCVPSSRHN